MKHNKISDSIGHAKNYKKLMEECAKIRYKMAIVGSNMSPDMKETIKMVEDYAEEKLNKVMGVPLELMNDSNEVSPRVRKTVKIYDPNTFEVVDRVVPEKYVYELTPSQKRLVRILINILESNQFTSEGVNTDYIAFDQRLNNIYLKEQYETDDRKMLNELKERYKTEIKRTWDRNK